MDIINKQKFLAELGRLLTFMYEEDRQTVLAMYGRMFDETADEDGLLELLVSPTRQAVVLARSYDAKARKEQIENGEADYIADPENAPAFIFIIDKTAQQAAELGVKEENAVAEGQFSIFDETAELPDLWDKAIEAGAAADEPIALTDEAEIPSRDEPEEVRTPVLPEAEEAEAVVPPEAEEPAPLEKAPEAAPVEERSSVDETADAVEAFLADFSIENGELISVKTAAAPAEEESFNLEFEALFETDKVNPAENTLETDVQHKVKTNVLLLILYILLAIPVGFIGVAILLLPAVFFLGLAAVFAYVGVSTIGMCFGSFAVIADTMAVFGAGLALAAMALLFVWLFIWFIGGAIVGFICGLCRLGRKICCKEVAVQ